MNEDEQEVLNILVHEQNIEDGYDENGELRVEKV